MKNDNVIGLIRESCTVSAPDRFTALSFEDAVQYKNTVPKVSMKRSYVYAATIYAAACIVVLITIPFIIGGRGGDADIEPGAVPVSTTDNQTVTDVLPDNYTVDFAETDDEVKTKFLEAIDRAYADGRITVEHDKNECVDVTPNDILNETGARIFAFVDTYYSYIFVDDEVYGVFRNGNAIAAPGVLPYDYNNDGYMDIMLIVPWTNKNQSKKGMVVSFFDMKDKTTDSRKIGLDYNETVTVEIDEDGNKRYAVKNSELIVYPERRFAVIPVAGDELKGYIENRDGEIVYEKYDPLREMIFNAFDRAVLDGRVAEEEYWRYEFQIISDKELNDETFVFKPFGYSGCYVYTEDEIYPLTYPGHFYDAHSAVACDPDNNGIEDYFIYGTWGSGVYGYALSYFDMNTKQDISIYHDSFYYVYVKEKTDSGNTVYELYSTMLRSNDERYIGTLKYDDGKIVTEFIQGNDFKEAIKYAFEK